MGLYSPVDPMSNPTLKKTDRTEIAWVQFQANARTRPSAPLGVDFVQATDQTKLFVGEVAGIPCVFIEHADSKTGRVPMTNVASFGVLE